MNQQHYARLQDSSWNQWRVDNPDVVPDLRWADLSGANLRWAKIFNDQKSALLSAIGIHIIED